MNTGISFTPKTEVTEGEIGAVGQQMLEYLNKIYEGNTKAESDKAYGARVCAKARAGKKLTPEEMNYLADNYPDLYIKALRAQAMRRALENKLSSCKSKQEAQDALSVAVNSISDKDPDKEMITGALNEAFKEFKKSGAYERLPEKAEEEGQEKQAGRLQYHINEEGYQETFSDNMETTFFSARG